MAEIMPPRALREEDEVAKKALMRRLIIERESDPATAETTMGRGWDAAPVEMQNAVFRPDTPPAERQNVPLSRGSTSSMSDAIRARLIEEQRKQSSAMAKPSPDHGAVSPERVQAPGGDEVAPRGFTPYHTPESSQRVETQFRLEQALKRSSHQDQQVLMNVLSMARSDDEVARILDDYEKRTMVR